MEFTQSISYPASADEVVAMYLAPAYLERRFGAFLVEGSARIRVEGQRITLDGECRPELIPAAAARFVASPLRVTFTEEWASDEARARSRSSVTVDGAPVSVEATSTWPPRRGDARARSWDRCPCACRCWGHALSARPLLAWAVLQTGRRSWPPPGWRSTARLFAVRKK